MKKEDVKYYLKHYPELKTNFHFQEGYQEGLREVREEVRRSIAQNMRQKGFLLAEIADVLNLTPKEIERLLNDEPPSH